MATSAIDPITKQTPAALAKIDAATNPALASLSAKDSKGSKATAAGLKLADDFDSFLRMLTTQLQNQDPTQPLDTNQFTQQLVAFSGVEQSVAMNKNLEALLSLQQGNQASTAVNYIGKVVDSEGTQLSLQKGQAVFSVEVPVGAASVTVGVVDSAGKPLYSSTTRGVSAGLHDFGWNGQNSFGGAKAADGLYTFGVVSKDAAGKVLTTKTYTSGLVTAVETNGEEPVLTITGGLKIPLSKVATIRQDPDVTAPAATTPPTTTAGTNNNNTATGNQS